MSTSPFFEHLLALLRQEKEEDLQQFVEQVRQRPLAQRVEQGYTWYPLKVVQTGFSLGEKAFVIVERTTRLNEPHQLRSGMSVNFFTTTEHVKNPEKTGVINFVERNRMKIILNARDVPEWLNLGHLGVDMLFDDRTYLEMERALNAVMAAKGNRLAELRGLLTPPPTPSPPREGAPSAALRHLTEGQDEKPPLLGGRGLGVGLNESQARAVNAILNNPDVCIVHGPPGTGKTTTLVAAIALLAERESTVLVTAPSNTAADLLTERLADKGLNVVRIGNISRVDEAVVSHTLEAILARHPESRNIKKVKIQAAEYRRQSKRFKRTFDAEDRRERDHLRDQARELEAWANTLEDRLVEQVLSSAQAITCTLVGAAHPVLERYKFRTCVIDEAAQALEPACWIPILKSSRVVLAGDPFQLPPTVKSQSAARNGLSNTLIERCLMLLPDRVHLLDVQYRMHRAIMDFSNQYFYEGALQAHGSVGERRLMALDAGGETLTVFDPVSFVDTAGCGFDERLGSKSNDARAQSRFNPEEALLVREHLLQLLEHFPTPPADAPGLSIGILSPYREQVNHLDEVLRDDPVLAPFLRGHGVAGQPRSGDALAESAPATLALPPGTQITINTIDGFQGQERDVIYLSLVRSNTKNEIGFLSDYRRMNVAMTRARMLLVVIGDSATIGKNKFYEAFLDYCEKHGKYQTAWEYLR
jgi:superfamily I DNA and/or RNA helicase